ncbi:hypothetical protein HPB50_018115 [Hyalomma asiaticum]|uniref:Uncharacterized protein n=1 Tax=Hyalomma asiaticum TaxID=266040 RepID=A0ACB7RVC6_HYAAI|nr:hypothetical protein HPB50_018115 [Hyalomma asiaticum]
MQLSSSTFIGAAAQSANKPNTRTGPHGQRRTRGAAPVTFHGTPRLGDRGHTREEVEERRTGDIPLLLFFLGHLRCNGRAEDAKQSEEEDGRQLRRPRQRGHYTEKTQWWKTAVSRILKARSHRARIRKAERRIRKADADYPQKRKIRGRFSGSRPDRFCPRGKVGRFGRSQSGPESPASIMSEPAVLFSVELLLDTIKQHLVLYKTNPRYKEAEYKKEIWKKIAQDLGATSPRTVCPARGVRGLLIRQNNKIIIIIIIYPDERRQSEQRRATAPQASGGGNNLGGTAMPSSAAGATATATATGASTPVTELDRVVAYANRFSIKLFKHVAALDPRSTVCIGPFGVFKTLCMAYAGAQGNTEHQMAKAFYFHTLTVPPPRDDCWQDEPDNVREQVNSTIEKDTSGAIPRLLVSGVTDPDSRIVLCDSIFIKASWETVFPVSAAATEKHPYTVSTSRSAGGSMAAGSDRGPELVRISGVYRHCRDAENKLLAVEVPLRGGQLSLLLFLADNAPSLRRFHKHLSLDLYERLLDKLQDTGERISVLVPKMHLEEMVQPSYVLKHMGFLDLFDEHANLAGVGQNLFVSDIIHKVTLTIDSTGVTAATAVSLSLTNFYTEELPKAYRDAPNSRPFHLHPQDAGDGPHTIRGRRAGHLMPVSRTWRHRRPVGHALGRARWRSRRRRATLGSQVAASAAATAAATPQPPSRVGSPPAMALDTERFNEQAMALFRAALDCSSPDANVLCSPLGIASAMAAADAPSPKRDAMGPCMGDVEGVAACVRRLRRCDAVRIGNLLHVDAKTRLDDDYRTLFEGSLEGKVRTTEAASEQGAAAAKDIGDSTNCWASELTDGAVTRIFGWPGAAEAAEATPNAHQDSAKHTASKEMTAPLAGPLVHTFPL